MIECLKIIVSRQFYVFVIFLVIFSCNKNEFEIQKYDEDDEHFIDTLWSHRDSSILSCYDCNNLLIYRLIYKSGKRHGESCEFYSNGQIRIFENHLNGSLQGLSKEYTSNGVLKRTSYYQKGKIVYLKDLEREGAKPIFLIKDTVQINEIVDLEMRFVPNSFLDSIDVKLGVVECEIDSIDVKPILFDKNGIAKDRIRFFESGNYCFKGYTTNNDWKIEFSHEITVVD